MSESAAVSPSAFPNLSKLKQFLDGCLNPHELGSLEIGAAAAICRSFAFDRELNDLLIWAVSPAKMLAFKREANAFREADRCWTRLRSLLDGGSSHGLTSADIDLQLFFLSLKA